MAATLPPRAGTEIGAAARPRDDAPEDRIAWGSIARFTWPAATAIVLLVVVNLVSLRIADVLELGLVNGSRVAKSQKTATLHLLRHIDGGRPADLENFRAELERPLLAGRGREALVAGDYEAARQALVELGMKPAEAEGRIQLFRVANGLEGFRYIQAQWSMADALLAQMEQIALASAALHAGESSAASRRALSIRLLDVDHRFTEATTRLADGILALARDFRTVERAVNLVLAAVLLASTLLVAGRGLARLSRARAALRDAGERYELAVTAANDGLWDWVLPSRQFFWSARLRELLGYPPGHGFAGRLGLRELLHPGDRAMAMAALRAHLRGRTARCDLELRLHCADGAWRWFQVRGCAQRDARGRATRMLGTLTDIDVRMQAELAQAEAVREREQAMAELELALNAAHVALWGFEPATGRVLHARRWDTLLGYAEMPTHLDAWNQLVHPDDRAARRHAFERHLAGEEEHAEAEFRMRNAEGRWVWLRSRGCVTRRDAEGRPLEFHAAVMNLSEQVAARELQRRQQEFLQAMVDGIDTGVVLSSVDRIHYVNASLCRMLGLRREVLIGASVTELASTPAAARRMLARRHAMMAGADQPLVVGEVRGAGGQALPVVVALSHVQWNGESHFITTLTPLHAYERLEAKLKSAEARFERVLLGHLEAQQAQIAHELHDSLGSALAGLSLLIGIAKTAAAQGAPVDAVLDRCQQQVQGAVESARALAHGIMPVDDRPGALLHALDRFVDDLRTKGVEATLQVKGSLDDLPPAAANHVYRVVQEAASNALRHGRATALRISLEQGPQARVFRVEDNGSGLPPAWQQKGQGIGMRSMRARAEALGGTLRLGAAPGGGTMVTLRVPNGAPKLPASDAPAAIAETS